MTTTLQSKTLTSSLPGDADDTFDWIADPAHLPEWYGSLAQFGPPRFIREDRARLLDLVLTTSATELRVAIRILANGGGCEIVLTLIQPRGLPDSEFLEYVRFAETALSDLQNLQLGNPVSTPSIEPAAESAPAPVAGRNLFVGNLPFAWAEEPLRELFAAHGTVVTVRIARLRGRGGRSRGFGFVEMSTEVEAQTAIEKLHETLAGERKIIVRLARSQENRTAAGGGAPSEKGAAVHPPAGRGVRRPPGGEPRRGGPQRGEPRRSPRPGRNSRPTKPSGAPSARRDSGGARPARQTGISNSSGYEIYPRDSKGVVSSEPTARSAAPRPTEIEPSPYFEDSGDIENRGNRPPRHRRR